jgi:DNA repair protein SbcD/Mre11
MKILHAADLHVGDSRNLPGYLDRQRKMLYGITDIAIREAVQAVVLAGDIHDAKYMLPREKDMLWEWTLHLDFTAQEHDFDVVIENGNHDEIEEDYTHLRSLRIAQDYRMLRRTIVVEAKPELVGPLHEKLWIAVIPAKSYQGDEINEHVRAMLASLDKRSDPDDRYVVAMVHEAIIGAVNEAGTQKFKRGPKLDPELPVTYWALGDIHKPFQMMLPNAWYSGSPIQHDFGDISPERGVLIVDLDEPTAPKPVLLEGIHPLVTIQAGDEVPADAIVRFEGDAQEIAETVFPENVVSFKPSVDGAIKSVVDTAGLGLLDDLDSVLADQKVPEDLQQEVVDEVRSALAEA